MEEEDEEEDENKKQATEEKEFQSYLHTCKYDTSLEQDSTTKKEGCCASTSQRQPDLSAYPAHRQTASTWTSTGYLQHTNDQCHLHFLFRHHSETGPSVLRS